MSNSTICLLRSFKHLQLVPWLAIAIFAAAAAAQTDTPPCQPLSQDRTITFCYPIDGSSVSTDSLLDWGWITDSLPHTAKMYIDGQYVTSPPDIFNGGPGYGWDDKVHNFQIVVTDSKGTFSKTVSARQSPLLPCPMSTSDPGLVVCKPDNGEVDASPLRLAAVANNSKGIQYIQVYVDGVKIGTEHWAGTNTVRIWNGFTYLDNGTHKLSFIARQSDGTEIKVHRTITVVTYVP